LQNNDLLGRPEVHLSWSYPVLWRGGFGRWKL